MNGALCIPDAMSNQIMGRIHVGTPDDRALCQWAESLKDIESTNARWLFYAAARALTQHHRNGDEYRSVMGGGTCRAVSINGRLELEELK